jgi:hypothetical protein
VSLRSAVAARVVFTRGGTGACITVHSSTSPIASTPSAPTPHGTFKIVHV